jgi:hypothetical protein
MRTPPPRSKTLPSRNACASVRATNAVERTDAGKIRFVQMPGHGGKQVVAGDVVFVAVAVDDAIDVRERVISRHQPEAGIDHDALFGAAHEQ